MGTFRLVLQILGFCFLSYAFGRLLNNLSIYVEDPYGETPPNAGGGLFSILGMVFYAVGLPVTALCSFLNRCPRYHIERWARNDERRKIEDPNYTSDYPMPRATEFTFVRAVATVIGVLVATAIVGLGFYFDVFPSFLASDDSENSSFLLLIFLIVAMYGFLGYLIPVYIDSAVSKRDGK